jgi:hypothetical protein
MVVAVAQDAHARAVRHNIAEIARYLQEVLGQSLTALIADVRNPKAVGKWARGDRIPHPAAEQRLRAAYQVTEELIRVESPQTIRTWFLSMNPLLEDELPARALARDPVSVLKAARLFASSG